MLNATNWQRSGIGSHPLLVGQSNLVDTANVRAQRALRQRRFQYLQWTNPRNPNPPVILQRYVLGVLAMFQKDIFFMKISIIRRYIANLCFFMCAGCWYRLHRLYRWQRVKYWHQVFATRVSSLWTIHSEFSLIRKRNRSTLS